MSDVFRYHAGGIDPRRYGFGPEMVAAARAQQSGAEQPRRSIFGETVPGSGGTAGTTTEATIEGGGSSTGENILALGGLGVGAAGLGAKVYDLLGPETQGEILEFFGGDATKAAEYAGGARAMPDGGPLRAQPAQPGGDSLFGDPYGASPYVRSAAYQPRSVFQSAQTGGAGQSVGDVLDGPNIGTGGGPLDSPNAGALAGSSPVDQIGALAAAGNTTEAVRIATQLARGGPQAAKSAADALAAAGVGGANPADLAAGAFSPPSSAPTSGAPAGGGSIMADLFGEEVAGALGTAGNVVSIATLPLSLKAFFDDPSGPNAVGAGLSAAGAAGAASSLAGGSGLPLVAGGPGLATVAGVLGIPLAAKAIADYFDKPSVGPSAHQNFAFPNQTEDGRFRTAEFGMDNGADGGLDGGVAARIKEAGGMAVETANKLLDMGFTYDPAASVGKTGAAITSRPDLGAGSTSGSAWLQHLMKSGALKPPADLDADRFGEVLSSLAQREDAMWRQFDEATRSVQGQQAGSRLIQNTISGGGGMTVQEALSAGELSPEERAYINQWYATNPGYQNPLDAEASRPQRHDGGR